MTALLLSDNKIPVSVGGKTEYYTYMLKIHMNFKQAVTLPPSIVNKNVLLLGDTWTIRSMSNKTSQNSITLTWNNFANAIDFHGLSKYYTAYYKIKVEKRFNFGNIDKLQIMLSSYQTGSARAARGWNAPGSEHLSPQASLTFYWN